MLRAVMTSLQGKSAFPRIILGAWRGIELPQTVHHFLLNSDVIFASAAASPHRIWVPIQRQDPHPATWSLDVNKDVPVQHVLIGMPS